MYKKPFENIKNWPSLISALKDEKITGPGEVNSVFCAYDEAPQWLNMRNDIPVWSRILRHNGTANYSKRRTATVNQFVVEIDGRLWSLWGNLHPMAPVFDKSSRGKQYLACNVIACCAAALYNIMDWNAQLLDVIVISGDEYHRNSLAKIKKKDYEFSLENLNTECTLENFKFVVHLEHVVYGRLYSAPTRCRFNLCEGLIYFFAHYQFGILQCFNRSLAIGRLSDTDDNFFMFDCQSKDHPIFPRGQGAAYVLRTKYLQDLLYCIVITLNVPFNDIKFSLHEVLMKRSFKK